LYTAGFRCLTCRRPLKVEFRFCAPRWIARLDRRVTAIRRVTHAYRNRCSRWSACRLGRMT
jgi:hypothetical protein